MENCKIAQFVESPNGGLKKVIYTCCQIKKDLDQMKANFMSMAGPGEIYDQYCGTLYNFLSKCKCDPLSERCEKCSEEDHEGCFCRCEGRNIRTAKKLREKGLSPWQKDNKAEGASHRERLSERDASNGVSDSLNSMET